MNQPEREKIDFLCECLPHVPQLTVINYVRQFGRTTDASQLCDELLKRYPAPKLDNDPILITEDDDDDDNDVVFVDSVSVEPPRVQLGANNQPVTNSTLASLNRARMERQKMSSVPHKHKTNNTTTSQLSATPDRSKLLAAHERRLQQVPSDGLCNDNGKRPMNRESDGQDLLRETAAKRRKQNDSTTTGPNVADQLKYIQNKHKNKWKQDTPTAKMMTLNDLGKREQLVMQSKIGDWSESKPSNHGGIHTIDNTFFDPDRIGQEALKYTNEFRAQQGLPPLKWSQPIANIGKQHSKDMGDGKVPFGHDGFNARVQQYPIPSSSAAENVAWNAGTSEVAKVAVDGWIKSPGHRKNLLANHNFCGIGVYKNASGRFYLTQLFALA